MSPFLIFFNFVVTHTIANFIQLSYNSCAEGEELILNLSLSVRPRPGTEKCGLGADLKRTGRQNKPVKVA